MNESIRSPKWNGSTKMTVGLTFIALTAGFLIKFQNIISPLIMVFLLAYLLSPIARLINRKFHLHWKASVTIVYLFTFIVLLAALTLGGVGIAQQFENLLSLIQNSIKNIPSVFAQISKQQFYIGPFLLDMRSLDLVTIEQQLISSMEPIISKTGTMVGTLAGSAANFLGWTLFVLLVSYFVLAESDKLGREIFQFNIPGYQNDLKQLEKQINQLWNSFFRGQLIVMGMATIIYIVVLSILGVNYALGLAIFAGLTRLVPYVGPLMLWIILTLVSYFQDFKLFGMEAWPYTLIVVAICWVIDLITDNFIMPRIMATALKVHPAAVLIAAIIALDLFGFLGVLIAAPMLATLQLIGRYLSRKMFDMNPWEGLEEIHPLPSIRQQIRQWIKRFYRIFKRT